MISLFLTALLGLFCCSSINNNALDHTKEVQAKENYIKNAVPSVNTDGSLDFVYYFSSDLLSYEIAINFITSMVEAQGQQWSANNTTNVNFTFNNVIANVSYLNSNDFFQPVYNVSRIDVFKDYQFSFVVDNTMIYVNNYNVVFVIDGYTNCFIVSYLVYAPIGLTAAIIPSISYTGNTMASNNWTYQENADTGSAPITKLAYQKLYDDILFSPQTYEQQGYNNGYNKGYNDGRANGYQSGYTAGVTYAQQQNQTALTIFQGFIEVGLLPVNVFLQILNFEIFGINIAGFVSSLLTISLVIIIIRIITGKKDD